VTWYLIAAIFLIGLWGIIAEPNLIRKVIALSIANSGITVMYVGTDSAGLRHSG